MAHRVLETPEDVANFARLLGNLELPLTVEWTKGRDRSRSQNALQFLWAKEAAEQLADQTTEEVRQGWKLRYGVPILREDSAAFRDVYDKAIRPLSYELKVEAMAFIPVSSLMNVRQMVRYLDTIERECAQQGIRLTPPDPEMASYHARYRAKSKQPTENV